MLLSPGISEADSHHCRGITGGKQMEIKILGTGCPKCKRLEALVRQVAAEAGIEANFTKVTDFAQITSYSVLNTPGLVINEEVRSSGRIPRKEEIISWMEEAQG
jgi:small redox-active disulfide protein 2